MFVFLELEFCKVRAHNSRSRSQSARTKPDLRKSQFEPHGSHVIRCSSKTQPHILDLELERILRNRIRQHIITAGSG